MTADGLAVQQNMQRLYFSYKSGPNAYHIDYVNIPVATSPPATRFPFVTLQNEIRELAVDNK